MVFDADFWFWKPIELDPNNIVELRDADLLTPSLLLACDSIVRSQPDWGIMIVSRKPGSEDVVPLVQTNGGGFTPLSGGGKKIQRTIYDAIKQRGDTWLRNVPPPDAE